MGHGRRLGFQRSIAGDPRRGGCLDWIGKFGKPLAHGTNLTIAAWMLICTLFNFVLPGQCARLHAHFVTFHSISLFSLFMFSPSMNISSLPCNSKWCMILFVLFFQGRWLRSDGGGKDACESANTQKCFLSRHHHRSGQDAFQLSKYRYYMSSNNFVIHHDTKKALQASISWLISTKTLTHIKHLLIISVLCVFVSYQKGSFICCFPTRKSFTACGTSTTCCSPTSSTSSTTSASSSACGSATSSRSFTATGK